MSISSPFTILLVDDNRDLIELLDHVLSHNGFNVHSVDNGPACLDVVRRQEFDLVILDVMMPQMDGLTVCEALKKFVPSLPVFFLTARNDPPTRTAAIQLGAAGFFTKPVDMEDFVKRVRTQCQTGRLNMPQSAPLVVKA